MTQTQPRHNLPARDYERFVGRQEELGALHRLLQPYPKSRYHLITVDGIGGIGKSALVLEAAYRLGDAYAELPAAERFDAVIWVSAKRTYLTSHGIEERAQSLRGLDDLFAAVAQVLDYPAITRARTEEQRSIVEQVLAEQRTLLLLDNMETVDDEALLGFLRELPDPTKAIVTTRHRIDVAYPVRLTGMPHADAMALIEQTSSAKGVALTLDEREELWTRSGGVPLALVWSIGLIAAGVAPDEVLRQLGQGQSDIARFCFEESIAHVRGRDAHRLILALALFAAEASRDALGVVAGLADDPFGRDGGLDELLRLSLVNKDGDRFSLLPLTRSFVQHSSPQNDAWLENARVRLVQYYNQLTMERGGWSKDWEGQALIERELPNLLAILDDLRVSLRYDELPEGGRRISQHSIATGKLICKIAPRVARTCRVRGDWTASERLCWDVIKISRDLGEQDHVGHRYWDLARINLMRGDINRAEQHLRSSITELEPLRREGTIARATSALGLIALKRGNFAEAQRLISSSLTAYETTGSDYALADLIWNAGSFALHTDDLAGAEELFRQALGVARSADDLTRLAKAWIGLGDTLAKMGKQSEALAAYAGGLKAGEESGRLDSISEASLGIARLHAIGDASTAARPYAERALDLFRRLGMRAEQAEAEALLAQLHAGAPTSSPIVPSEIEDSCDRI